MENYELLNEDMFITNFGLNSKLIRRDKIPAFIKHALSLNNSFINDKIKQDIMFYLFKCKKQNLPELLNILFNFNEEYKEIIINNFDGWSSLIVPLNVVEILKVLINDTNCYSLIKNNMSLFLENACLEDEKIVINMLYNINECKNILSQIIKIKEKDKPYYKNMNLGTYYNLYVNGLIKEIDNYFYQYSNGNIESIKYLFTGHTNVVYVAGTTDRYIIKIGKKRNIFDITFFSYILEPYVRKEYLINKKVIATIEIQDFCNTLNIKEEDYKNLLEQIKKENLVWLDENTYNVGYLLKPNKRKSKEVGFDYTDSFNSEPKGEIGDLVIIDSDMLLSSKRTKLRHLKYNLVSNYYDYTIIIDANVYNIDNCIKKLLNQIFKNFKVIIINCQNGSIIENYNTIDSRINSDNNLIGDIINYSSDFDNPYYLYNKKYNMKLELK